MEKYIQSLFIIFIILFFNNFLIAQSNLNKEYKKKISSLKNEKINHSTNLKQEYIEFKKLPKELKAANKEELKSKRIIKEKTNDSLDKEISKEERIFHWQNYRNRKKNIISAIPFSLFTKNAFYFTENYFPIGVSYERILNPYISVQIPFQIDNKNKITNSGIQLKYYLNAQGVCKFSMGALLNYMRSPAYDYFYNQYGFTQLEKGVNKRVGFFIIHSINTTISDRIFIGTNAGFGIDLNVNNKFKLDENSNIHYREFSNQYEYNYLNLNLSVQVGYKF